MIANSELIEQQAPTREASSPSAEQRPRPRPRPQVPAVDIYESERSVILLADVPGVADDGVDLTIDRGVLTLRARSKQAPPEGFTPIYQEYAAADFERQFTLGDGIDSERITATVTNGVLRLELPKASRALQRRIPVKAG